MVLFGVKIGQQHGKFTPDWQSPQISGILVCNEIRLELAGKYLIIPRIVCAWLCVCAYSVVSVVRTEYLEGISPAVFLDSTATVPF